MSCKVGMLPLSIPALGFMLHAAVTIVLQECKMLTSVTFLIQNTTNYDVSFHLKSMLFSDVGFLLLYWHFPTLSSQWSWKCKFIWSTGFTARSAYKFAIFVSHIFTMKFVIFIGLMFEYIYLFSFYFLDNWGYQCQFACTSKLLWGCEVNNWVKHQCPRDSN